MGNEVKTCEYNYNGYCLGQKNMPKCYYDLKRSCQKFISEDSIKTGRFGTIENIAITDEGYLYQHCVTAIHFAVFWNEGNEVDKQYKFRGCGILEKSETEPDTLLLVGINVTYATMPLEEIKSGYYIIIEVGE